jgi:ABC-type glycerol-3-phosphate transport system substrate-binding protein
MKGHIPPHALRRRQFLQGTAGLGALSLAGGLGARRALAQDATLDMWWWGEQELPGLQAYLEKAIAAFPDANITPMLQDTAVVISQFQTAAAAGDPPDIQYLWNGIYHMESVWLGYLAALDEAMDPATLAASNHGPLSVFDGHTWRMGWYPLPMPWYYNKDLFDKAGLASLLAQHLSGQFDHGQLLWQLMVMQGFLAQSAGSPAMAGPMAENRP